MEESERNELTLYSANAVMAVAKEKGSNYVITSPLTGISETIKRNVDFGVVPKTKKPSLYKSGAEKVIMAYQLMARYTVESKIESYNEQKGTAFFYYMVKCSLYKGGVTPDGKYTEVEYANGFGSSNTLESRNGSSSAFNAANATLKMAEKRALVQAALTVSGLSSMFSQDMEDETAVNLSEMVEQKPGSKINSAQRTRIFNVAAQHGLTQEEFKRWLSAEGYPKTSELTVTQFEEIIEKLKKIDEVKNVAEN